ncbi:MAG: hypothetical protein Q9217_004891 [Psora testacea]
MSLRIAPASTHATTASNTKQTTTKGAPSAPGVHDILRTNLSLNPSSSSTTALSSTTPNPQPLQSSHPLESRLRNWQSTQESLKLNLLRRQFGIGEPVRRGMEMRICREGEWRPYCLGGSARVGENVLAGRDTEITWEDVYIGDEIREIDYHAEMEARVRMGEW